MEVSVQEASFDVGQELTAFTAGAEGSGAVVSFTGITRDIAGGLRHMEIEHYPGMTERALGDIRLEAITRFGLTGARIIHRYGRVAPNEVIMMVLTAAPHRADAFKGAEFLMDYLKSRAPFWKREVTADGAEWVAAKDEDEDALKRW
ncbi:molybdenum cofactor biosynthesis protein MoaE [Marimonas sp. MJW-29]|uniref:Molybdopterin synthase catalytic subunit n=1 Tax=Sulfitobacter sediminis TaxID=3234186 RepID=A0ABV3RMC2_9RHOB